MLSIISLDQIHQLRADPEAFARTITDVVNVVGNEEFLKETARCITSSHRTLQQTVMRLMIETIVAWSKMYDAGMYDARNEDTCRICKEIATLFAEAEAGLYVRHV